MGFSCVVPGCKSNYNHNEQYVSVFQFPKDAELRKKWINAIKRERSFEVTTNSRVCEKHFREDDIIRTTSFFDQQTGRTITAPLKRPKPKSDAIPCYLPNCPSYLSQPVPTSRRESVEIKRQRVEEANIDFAIAESVKSHENFLNNTSYKNFNEFLDCLQKNEGSGSFNTWLIVRKNDCVVFLLIQNYNDFDSGPKISVAVTVLQNLNVIIFQDGIKQVDKIGQFVPGNQIVNIKILETLLDDIVKIRSQEPAPLQDAMLSNICKMLEQISKYLPEQQRKIIQFATEQVNLCTINPNRYRYSSDLLILSSLFYSISAHAYRFVRSTGYILLPHPTTIRKLCAKYDINPLHEQNDDKFLNYVGQRSKTLPEREKLVALLMDEIHLKQYYDYKGGNIVGGAYNSAEAAKTAYVFMIRSLLSDFKEVAHILPVRTIDGDTLHQVIKKIIIGLHDIGYKVICVVSDNNALNGKAMKLFDPSFELRTWYPHPCWTNMPLFFLFDSVHILKCVRNNWINKTDWQKIIHYPSFYPSGANETCDQVASFNSIRKIYHFEEKRVVKYAYSLNLKSLYPSNTERQNVKFVLNVFHHSVIDGLKKYKDDIPQSDFISTADFIDIIIDWWSVVNVKTVFKGIRRKNDLENPMMIGNEPRVYLENFWKWLNRWSTTKNGLTRETFTAIRHTTEALIQMSDFCINNLKFSYFLPGKIQTDSLEDRFGKYRMMAGGQYLVSIRQIFEVENKIRLQNVLPLKLGKIIINISEIEDIDIPGFGDNDAVNSAAMEKLCESFEIDFEMDTYFEDIESYLPCLTMIAGSCLRVALKKVKCVEFTKSCTLEKSDDELNRPSNILIKENDRGSLYLPHPDVVNIICITYVVIQQLINDRNEKSFLKNDQQRSIASYLSLKIINAELNFDSLNCHIDDHDHIKQFLKFVVRSACNTILKNYVRKKNERVAFASIENKSRKLNTVKS